MALWFGKNKEESSKSEEVVSTPSPKKVVKPVGQELMSPVPTGGVIRSSLDFDAPVQISGQIEGEIFSASAVTVAKDGVISGKAEADSFEIYGTASGELRARSKLVLHKGCQVSATIEAPELEVKEGACLNGSCSVMRGVS